MVNFLIGCRANLFFALHSYCPESLMKAALMINSERRLKLFVFKVTLNVFFYQSWHNQEKVVIILRLVYTCLKCINWYLERFLAIDRLSLNHVTFGGGRPRTLHTILSRFPSFIVTLFATRDSIYARWPITFKRMDINIYILDVYSDLVKKKEKFGTCSN